MKNQETLEQYFDRTVMNFVAPSPSRTMACANSIERSVSARANSLPSGVLMPVIAGEIDAWMQGWLDVWEAPIRLDPNWREGDYYGRGKGPEKGLAVARMAAHITYLSEEGLTEKFGRRLQNRDAVSFGFDADFQVESYLRHQGISFSPFSMASRSAKLSPCVQIPPPAGSSQRAT